MLTPTALQAKFTRQANESLSPAGAYELFQAADQLGPLIEAWGKMRLALNNLVAYSVGFLPSGCNALKAAEEVLRETAE